MIFPFCSHCLSNQPQVSSLNLKHLQPWFHFSDLEATCMFYIYSGKSGNIAWFIQSYFRIKELLWTCLGAQVASQS